MTVVPLLRTFDLMPRSRAITTNTTTITPIVALVSGALLIATACGGTDDSGSDVAASPTTAAVTTTAPTTTSAPATAPETTAATTVPEPDPTTPPTTAEPVDDETWRAEVDAGCSHYLPILAIPLPASGEPEILQEFVDAHREIHETAPPIASVEFSGPGRTPAELREIPSGIDDALDRADEAAAAGDFVGTLEATDGIGPRLGFLASAYASEGQSCGPSDAERAAQADLNVSILGPWQLEVGFDSMWVSQYLSDTVLRVDPNSGEVLARIEMPSRPIKLQPADGRMVVRTVDSYEMIDPVTDTIVASLFKSDVGPAANLSWAVDGALWICDGQRLHRYDLSTLTPVAVVELGLDCGQVHAAADLAVAWTYNEDPGDSGTSRAAFIDPETNSLIAAVDLAADATVPVVLDDVVFFPPTGGSLASVVDRSSWTLSAQDLGLFIDGGSQGTFDGTSIYVIADRGTGSIAVIDPTTFEVTGEIFAITTAPSLNSLAATPGTLWAVNNSGGLLQRFDTAS